MIITSGERLGLCVGLERAQAQQNLGGCGASLRFSLLPPPHKPL